MSKLRLLCLLSLLPAFLHRTKAADSCKACVSLNEHNFDKVVARFGVTLVKFDVAYPYGEQHDVYGAFGEQVARLDDLLLAEVGVKDYGDRENAPLALRFGVRKEDLPAVRLLVGGRPPVAFAGAWTVDGLRLFLNGHTDLRVGLPGCVEAFDAIAVKFVASAEKQRLLDEALRIETEPEAGPIYVRFMKRIIEGGGEFVTNEIARLNNIIDGGKINDKKKAELTQKMNILQSFVTKTKDEL